METTRTIAIDRQPVPVSEEVYRAYMRPEWAEQKREERARRCCVENGARCTGDCKTCAHALSGGVLSLDSLECDGVLPPDPKDAYAQWADKLCLNEALGHLLPVEQSLIHALFYERQTEHDYAAASGVSRQAVNKSKKRILHKLRGLLEGI